MPHGGSIPRVLTLAEREAARGASPLAGVRHPMAEESAPPAHLEARVHVEPPAKPKKIERNMRGLVEALFEEIDAMRDGSGSPERLKAVCGVASSIAGLLNTEMKFRKMGGSEEETAQRIRVITG